MTNAIWDQFCRIPMLANVKLTAALEYLVDRGESDIPGGRFRWVGRSSSSGPQSAELEAHGVALTGHVSPIEEREQFFVTEIMVDEIEETTLPRRTRKMTDERQGQFRFERSSSGDSQSGGEPK